MGLMVSVGPDHPNFHHAVGLAEAALRRGLTVFFYCVDEGVRAVADARLQALVERGLKLLACAYGARQRGLPLTGNAVYSGLAALSDLMAGTDRFVSFN